MANGSRTPVDIVLVRPVGMTLEKVASGGASSVERGASTAHLRLGRALQSWLPARSESLPQCPRMGPVDLKELGGVVEWASCSSYPRRRCACPRSGGRGGGRGRPRTPRVRSTTRNPSCLLRDAGLVCANRAPCAPRFARVLRSTIALSPPARDMRGQPIPGRGGKARDASIAGGANRWRIGGYLIHGTRFEAVRSDFPLRSTFLIRPQIARKSVPLVMRARLAPRRSVFFEVVTGADSRYAIWRTFVDSLVRPMNP